MTLPKELQVEYEKTILEIDFAGRREVLERTSFTGHVITAWNPKSCLATLEENLSFNLALKKLLINMGKAYFFCIGSNPDNTWREEGFAVEGLADSEAVEIGKLFNQNAIFKCNIGRKEILDCTD